MLKNIFGKRPFVLLSMPLVITVGLSQETWAFKQWVHEQVTEKQLKTCDFDEDSADEVGDSNYWTDVFESKNIAAHVDDNRLDLGSNRLDTKMKFIFTSLKACKRRDALDAFGEALHTVQDIYAHSNAVDNHFVPDLLKMENGEKHHCDAENGFAPDGLVTGYFNMNQFMYPCKLLYLASFPPDIPGYIRCMEEHNECTGEGRKEGNCCHRELNKDDVSQLNGANHPEARRQAEAATLKYWNLVKEHIISESKSPERSTYFLKMLRQKQQTTFFVIDDTGSMDIDLSQVKSQVNRLIDSLVESDFAPTLGLATFKDTVTNYGLFCDIEKFRPKINNLYASGGDDCPEVSLLALEKALTEVLHSFPEERSDIAKEGGVIILYTDASARNPNLGPTIKKLANSKGVAIHSVVTGDCVPATPASLEPAAKISDSGFEISHNNPVKTITKDEIKKQIRQAVRTQKSDPLTSPSGRILYQALADQTGGISFNVDRDEVDDVTPILLELGAPDTETFFSQSVSLSPSQTTIVNVPIDNTLSTRVTLMVNGAVQYSLPSVKIKRPDGSEVNASETGVTLTQLSSVVSYAIENPAIGNWQIKLFGKGNLFVRAYGKTTLRVNGLRLLTETLQPPRPGVDLIPIEGDPVSGAEIVTQIRFTTAPESVSMTLQRPDGTIISTPEVTSRDGVRRFQSTFNVPNEPFLIKFRGKTKEGNTFHRESSVILMPQPDEKLLIELSNFTVTETSDGTLLKWITAAEDDTAGFHLWQAQPLTGNCEDLEFTSVVRLTDKLLYAEGNFLSGAHYDYNVPDGKVEYCYGLEEVYFEGKDRRSTFYIIGPNLDEWIELSY
jgi:hypothetical protein